MLHQQFSMSIRLLKTGIRLLKTVVQDRQWLSLSPSLSPLSLSLSLSHEMSPYTIDMKCTQESQDVQNSYFSPW
jgi:hypothetical protein